MVKKQSLFLEFLAMDGTTNSGAGCADANHRCDRRWCDEGRISADEAGRVSGEQSERTVIAEGEEVHES